MTAVTYYCLGQDGSVPSTAEAYESRKRVLVFITGIANGQSDTLSDYVPGIVGIEGVVFCTITDARNSGTHPTWSGVVLTYPSKSSAALEMCVLGRMG